MQSSILVQYSVVSQSALLVKSGANKTFSVNEWIKVFNRNNNISQVPGFHTWGTRTTKRMVDGERVEFKTHRWNEWRASEAAGDKLHLVDKMRVKMAQYVV